VLGLVDVWIEIEGWRESPTRLPKEETVIAEMIISIVSSII